MKILFIGTVDFSYQCLKELLYMNADVVGIATIKANNYNSDFKDLTPLAKEYGIPIHYFKNINDSETVNWIRDKSPDIIFCWGLSQIIKNELLDVPPMGIVGVHPALLPENRGRHPMIWALVLGLKITGLTFFFMDSGADSGPILSQRQITIEESDNASTLYEKIKNSAIIQIRGFVPKLENKTFKAIDQDNSKANYWRKRTRKDGIIDWRMTNKAITNLVKALSEPYPGAEFYYKGEVIRAIKVSAYTDNINDNVEPGKILDVKENKPLIKTYDGAVVVEAYEPFMVFTKGEYCE